MWVLFLEDHAYRPSGDYRTTIEYLAGMRCSVTRECAEQAGPKAKPIRTPPRAEAALLVADPYWRPVNAVRGKNTRAAGLHAARDGI